MPKPQTQATKCTWLELAALDFGGHLHKKLRHFGKRKVDFLALFLESFRLLLVRVLALVLVVNAAILPHMFLVPAHICIVGSNRLAFGI